MELGESREDYLEAIYVLQYKERVEVKNVRIAEYLNVSKPSTTHSLRCLEDLGYIRTDACHVLHMTEKGRNLGEKIYERHLFFRKLLLEIGVDAKTANEEACHMEHVLSERSYQLFKEYVNGNEKRPV